MSTSHGIYNDELSIARDLSNRVDKQIDIDVLIYEEFALKMFSYLRERET
jgi:hypothetical protein